MEHLTVYEVSLLNSVNVEKRIICATELWYLHYVNVLDIVKIWNRAYILHEVREKRLSWCWPIR